MPECANSFDFNLNIATSQRFGRRQGQDLNANPAEVLLQRVGGTPSLALPALLCKSRRPIGKLEKFNPAGSVKDRVAAYVFSWLLDRFGPDWKGPIVESSSGNLGIALAMLGAINGIEVIIVVDPNTSEQNVAIMRAYGANIICETERDSKGLFHETKLARARQIADARQGYWVNQTANLLNAEAHSRTTGAEIADEFGTCVDVVVVATSSGGQIRGISEAIKAASPKTRILAVDAWGSLIFSKKPENYCTPGLGLSWPPALLDMGLIDEVCLVPDAVSFATARYLARSGLLVGPSSGAVAAACYRKLLDVPEARVLGILSDGGERYLTTLFDDDWMREKGFPENLQPEMLVREIAKLNLTENHA